MIPRISRNAVKEGFDTLPAAICYFDRNGLLRLINHRMQEIAGRPLWPGSADPYGSGAGAAQSRRRCPSCAMRPPASTNSRTERYIISRCALQDKYGIPYTEVMATDVTQLATLHACSCQQENERLADAKPPRKALI